MPNRIVVKVGSNVLTRDDGKLDITHVSALVDQLAWLRGQGHEVILVSSGAVASGRGELGSEPHLDSVEQRQLYSAVGQVKLVNTYYTLFREYGITVGQVLVVKENFTTPVEYSNLRACMSVMLDGGVMPVVNENDTVSVTELMFTDNDELSGLMAQIVEADTLILLSNVDGIYDGLPGDPSARLIAKVAPGDDVSGYVSDGKSTFGRGGMAAKCGIASRVAGSGIRVVIANGRREDILKDIMLRPDSTPHTEFLPARRSAGDKE